MIDIKQIFLNCTASNTYQRVDSTHPLDLYIGIDSIYRWSLLLIGNISHAPEITSSNILTVETRIRPDNRWTITISLTDNNYQDLFIVFCEDIINSSMQLLDKNMALLFVIHRYNKWRAMFSGIRKAFLTPIQIKGLLGEMYFLKTFLIPKYGNPKAALSWTGPRFLPQDFIIDDTWYEIKTISSNQPVVQISSIEQLDCQVQGFLVIIHADKTSSTKTNKLSLNSLYYDLLSLLQTDEDKIAFSNMLMKYGYIPRKEYESSEYLFDVKDTQIYLVNKDFPCLRRFQIPAGIIDAKYHISVNSIKKYKKG